MNFKQIHFVVILYVLNVCFSEDFLHKVNRLTSEEKQILRREKAQKIALQEFEDYCNENKLLKLKKDPMYRQLYKSKIELVKNRNDRYSNGTSTVLYHCGPKCLSENQKKNQGLRPKNTLKQRRTKRFVGFLPCKMTIPSSFSIPPNFSWRTLYNFPVKDQGDTSACWATSAASCLEYHSYRNNNITTPPSVQQACDCCPDANCDSGGFMSDYFDMCMSTGATSETAYSFDGQLSKCRLTSSMTRVIQTTTFRSYCYANTANETELAYLLYTYGPFTSAIYSSCEPFYYYNSGVITNKLCSPLGDVDHAVLIVGYGVDALTGLPYWECKNSWGDKWGENGYFKLQRDENCCSMMSFPEALIFPRP